MISDQSLLLSTTVLNDDNNYCMLVPISSARTITDSCLWIIKIDHKISHNSEDISCSFHCVNTTHTIVYYDSFIGFGLD